MRPAQTVPVWLFGESLLVSPKGVLMFGSRNTSAFGAARPAMMGPQPLCHTFSCLRKERSGAALKVSWQGWKAMGAEGPKGHC